jgi:hypothetical protein
VSDEGAAGGVVQVFVVGASAVGFLARLLGFRAGFETSVSGGDAGLAATAGTGTGVYVGGLDGGERFGRAKVRGAAGRAAAAERSAARFKAWARVHLRRWPTRPRWSCCFRQEEVQKLKIDPSRLTNIEPVPGSISAAQKEH